MALKRPPGLVKLFGPLVVRLLGRGVPMGPNGLLTVRGRRSGMPHTTPVAVVEVGGRRWVIGAYGEVNWVRNLRAAREAEFALGGLPRPITAAELGPAEAQAFFGGVLTPYAANLPLVSRPFVRWFLRNMLRDPAVAAATYPVFELHARPD